jgi:hypothetical protein
LGLTTLLAVSATASCELYDSPPRPSIQGLVEGVLPDRSQPIVIRFSEPIARESLVARIVKLETDEEGNLLNDPENELFTYDPVNAANQGGEGVFADGDRTFVITMIKPLPIGSALAFVMAPGLSDLEGNKQENELVLPFTYKLSCEDAAGTEGFPSGTYFFLADVEKPIMVQVQLWGKIIVDPATGTFKGQFTNADRDPDPNRCSPPCASSEACRLLPAEECVIPSMKAATEDEYSDFIVNATPPTGYSFRVDGCLSASEEGIAFVNLPADVVIQQPEVTIKGITLTASFSETDGSFRGTGGVRADDVLIGISPSGPAVGTVLARLVPEGDPRLPADLPGPE